MIFKARVDAWPPSGELVRWYDVETSRFWFDVTLTYGGADDEGGGGGGGGGRRTRVELLVVVACVCFFVGLAGAACVVRRASRKRLHETQGVELAEVARVEVAQAVVVDAKEVSPRPTAESRRVSFADSTDPLPSFPAPPADGLSSERATPADVA